VAASISLAWPAAADLGVACWLAVVSAVPGPHVYYTPYWVRDMGQVWPVSACALAYQAVFVGVCHAIARFAFAASDRTKGRRFLAAGVALAAADFLHGFLGGARGLDLLLEVASVGFYAFFLVALVWPRIREGALALDAGDRALRAGALWAAFPFPLFGGSLASILMIADRPGTFTGVWWCLHVAVPLGLAAWLTLRARRRGEWVAAVAADLDPVWRLAAAPNTPAWVKQLVRVRPPGEPFRETETLEPAAWVTRR
jgi:hypothetical protein